MEHAEITINRHNPHIDPVLSLWRWEIPSYLFLGGLTAGILILSGLLFLMKKEERFPFATRLAPILAPALLGLGMFFLFLDLEHKLYVWRVYMTFRWTSPMSWGSWVLVLVFPTSIAFGLAQLTAVHRQVVRDWLTRSRRLPTLFRRLDGLFVKACELVDSRAHLMPVFAGINVLLGAFIGIYTGILLSSFVSRPFWNTPLLGILFLTSGLSAASAFMMLGTRAEEEEHTMARIDIGFLIVELVILTQIFIGYFTSSQLHHSAGAMIFGGSYTGIFWMLVVLQGILFPLFMEIMELRGMFRFKVLTPLSVLVGGFLLRILFVYLGQMSQVDLTMAFPLELPL